MTKETRDEIVDILESDAVQASVDARTRILQIFDREHERTSAIIKDLSEKLENYRIQSIELRGALLTLKLFVEEG